MLFLLTFYSILFNYPAPPYTEFGSQYGRLSICPAFLPSFLHPNIIYILSSSPHSISLSCTTRTTVLFLPVLFLPVLFLSPSLYGVYIVSSLLQPDTRHLLLILCHYPAPPYRVQEAVWPPSCSWGSPPPNPPSFSQLRLCPIAYSACPSSHSTSPPPPPTIHHLCLPADHRIRPHHPPGGDGTVWGSAVFTGRDLAAVRLHHSAHPAAALHHRYTQCPSPSTLWSVDFGDLSPSLSSLVVSFCRSAQRRLLR